MTPCHVLFQKLDGQIEMAFDRPYGHLKLFGYLFCLYPLQISHEENLFPPGWHLFHQEIQVFVKVFFIEVFQRVIFSGICFSYSLSGSLLSSVFMETICRPIIAVLRK